MKQLLYRRKRYYLHVAPRVGAWIETIACVNRPPLSKSHPVWVRGLKPPTPIQSEAIPIVAPRVGAWIETLCCVGHITLDKVVVAPRVGAWIETLGMCYSHSIPPVAPRVGAWIETLTMRCSTDRIKSHPVWVRGLKQPLCRRKRYHLHVAPRVGAWIETQYPKRLCVLPKSHPVWVRGLKQTNILQ